MSPAHKLGGCRLERVQSHSEHSELYRAWSEELQRPVMIKVLAPRYPAGSRTARRFLRGGKLAMSLEHPNIVRTFAAGEDRGRPYMLMEFLDGHSLDRILKVREKLPYEVAAGIIRQSAKALEAAADKKIVHRCIDPSHIMLSPGGRTTMLGFGLARLAEAVDRAEAAITAEGALVNVSPYSPPETGEGVQDLRGDIYSLGCVFYHLLTGKPPFSASGPLELLRMHRTEDPWPVKDLLPDLPGGVAELVHLMLQKDLGRRLEHPSRVISLIDAAINPEILGAQGIKPDRTLVASTLQMLAVREKLTVLVCDDQECTLTAIRETLRRQGITVLTTRDGRAVLDTMKSRPVNMAVIDLKLPNVWGEELLDAMKSVQPTCKLVLTRTGDLAERLYRSGRYPVHACLARPLDLYALRRTVQEFFKTI